MKKGEIVLIPFPFSDLSGSKLRPAVILIETERDVTVNFITSQLYLLIETDIKISFSSTNGLKKDSLIRVGKFATLDKELVVGRLGTLEGKYLSLLNKSLTKILHLT